MRAKLVDPALHVRGWTEDLIRREETAGPIVLSEGGPRKLPKGRIDYTLRVRVAPQAQPAFKFAEDKRAIVITHVFRTPL